MQYLPPFALPAILFLTALGAALVCVVLVWFGSVPEVDEQPERQHRRVMITRLAHAGALVCFVLAGIMALIGFGAPARNGDRLSALARDAARDEHARDTETLRRELSDLAERVRRLEARPASTQPAEPTRPARAARAGTVRAAELPPRSTDRDLVSTRADDHNVLDGERPGPPTPVLPEPPRLADRQKQEERVRQNARTMDVPDPDASPDRIPDKGVANAPAPSVNAPPPSGKTDAVTPLTADGDRVRALGPTSDPVAAAPDPSAAARPPEPSREATPPSPSTETARARVRQWLDGEIREMRDGIHAEIRDARRRTESIVNWLRGLGNRISDGTPRRDPQ